MQTLDAARLVVGGLFLAYAAVLDWRTRRVPNRVWTSLGTLAGLLFLVDWLVIERFGWLTVAIAVGLAILAYVLWFVHLLAGGADAKALMALAVLVPVPIRWEFLDRSLPLWSSPLPGALVVLANSVLVFAAAPLGLFVWNLVRGDARFPAAFLGYRTDLDRAEARFVWIVDRIDEEGRTTQVLFPSRTSEEEYRANVARLRARGLRRVWVTPKIPFMLPLLAGFVAAFTLGDVLFRLVFEFVAATR